MAEDTGPESDRRAEAGPDDGNSGDRGPGEDERDRDAPSTEAVVDRYDFDDFGPADMASMTAAEWEAAFDPDAWVTGAELLDRVEAELRARVADREVFAVVERLAPERLRAHADAGWAEVHGDGTVEGSGTVLRDVKPTVALCSMPDYDPPEPPANGGLPDPASIRRETGALGDRVVQFVAAALGIAGLVLLGATLFGIAGPSGVIAGVAGVGFLVIGLVLFVAVANARLSHRFRAREFSERLRAATSPATDTGTDTAERDGPIAGPEIDGDDTGGA